MLWNPAYIGALGTRPVVASAMPTISSPVVGVDMSSLPSVFSDTGGTTLQATDGGAVARVNDAFGGGTLYFQQTTTGRRPTLVRNARGTLSALRFDGSRYVQLAGNPAPGTLFQGSAWTMYAVLRHSAVGDYQGIFVAGNAAGGTGGWGSNRLALEGDPSGRPLITKVSDTTENYASAPAGSAPTNGMIKVVARSGPLGLDITYKSTGGTFTASTGFPPGGDTATWDTALLGAEMSFGASQPLPQFLFFGDIFEWRFWGANATDAQRDALIGYGDLKWGT